MKEFEKRIVVTVDALAKDFDIERVNIAINYNMTEKHRLLSFQNDKDNEILKDVQSKFEIDKLFLGDISRRIYDILNQPCMNKVIEKATKGQL
ncbi:uncharacterized protein RHIMIDRAFT_242659 [Rhizopus microsporus ATCC 52813]|uniref:Uncharacterized protein n=1 Tax=Rhizopus microsporus ATCC 52813 TaxID=1340429 RepID=A0A2G4SF95_RHIZD|nr:uncharacterized protein RHIMIDRAFT_242659 [Rhizopus microsporus ATCC 52813]PHZ07451.1 hypothetical protein RHIMIDRAFT_242659 [Rhizopus microsporus ATCC 52813]